jgi:hypothetical protein
MADPLQDPSLFFADSGCAKDAGAAAGRFAGSPISSCDWPRHARQAPCGKQMPKI